MAVDYWSLTFDASGHVTAPDPSALLTQIGDSGATDVYVMSHGWGSSQAAAQHLYDTMFPLIRGAAGFPAGGRFIGVYWPSIWFPDPPAAAAAAVAPAVAAGSPGAADAAVSGATIAAAVSASMPTAAGKDLSRMGELIDTGLAAVTDGTGTDAAHTAALDEFHGLFQQVFAASGSTVSTEDGGEAPLLSSEQPKDDYQTLARAMGSAPTGGDAQGLGDIFGGIWNGAKDAIRVGSYFQMKGRAGDVGQHGLGPFLEQLHAARPEVRVHLIGHSFGARLVSFALAGITSADVSPVASLTLVQGAFSHWAFTQGADNPFGEAGALCAYADRVHGPMAATFTAADWAVGQWYPKASFLSGQDVEGTDAPGRWDGMGKDGFQKVTPGGDVSIPLAAGTSLAAGSFYRVDANGVINDTSQSAFAGAHSDIVKQPVADLIVAASNP